ncbi:MAG: hypothetical protein EKK57_11125 [Proteobacteria bacterium]|nr:MAG: hypothetical protein EKK57_11125 [Pseudomonadota bacterium]
MATNVQKTHSMAAGAGYSIPLGRDCAFVNLLAKADCYVRVVSSYNGDSTTAPVASPAPGAGTTADWTHLAASGDSYVCDYSKGFQSEATSFPKDRMTHVLVWAIAAGDLVINAR